jgi:hypothetical protein
MAREPYAAQVALLVRLLPFIAAEKVFALKRGTASICSIATSLGPR